MFWVESTKQRPVYSTVIVGGGPGGLGPLLWAAQRGCLEHWLKQGVALIECSGRLGGSLGGYGINSDSLGSSYLECLDAEALPDTLHWLWQDAAVQEMRLYRERFPPLSLVDRYMGCIGRGIATRLAGERNCELYLNTTVEGLSLQEDGTVAIGMRTHGSFQIVLARSVIVAIGGRQVGGEAELAPGLKVADCRKRREFQSGQLLRHEGLAKAEEIIRKAEGRRIVVLGGSHSAYASAEALLALPAAQTLGDGQLCIMQRRPPRIFYTNRAAAMTDGYAISAGDICPRTGRVNRMGGLRGHGRDLWRRIAGRADGAPETRVAVQPIQELSVCSLRTEIEQAAFVVSCFGYRSATLPIFDRRGERVRLAADENRNAVSETCRLLRADGVELPNIFGIGLGTGFRPSEAMGCEPNFDGQANSLWLYQNDIGGQIYSGIRGTWN